MKNHWIKKKEDRELEEFKKMDRKIIEDLNAALNESLKKDEWNHVAIVFDGTASEIYVNGKALSSEEVKEKYDENGFFK